ncbi:MAG: RNA methyltransferase [Myxococcales bacterium]|nr:RNA methyltransferase [Myxococcales bacterium]MCB9733047.1 RNA methyltransferase [Deltaproteobacteria bacterium]
MSALPQVHVALLHHPILNRVGEIVTTGVTNLDIHDLARSSRTYGCAGYWIVTPIAEQRAMVSRITAHWRDGDGPGLHPQRAEALSLARVAATLDDVVTAVTDEAGARPRLVGTTARLERATVGYDDLAAELATPGAAPALLLFGTGWGMTAATLAACDMILPPIAASAGRTGYNHLSVRAAAAIVLDRLLGQRR